MGFDTLYVSEMPNSSFSRIKLHYIGYIAPPLGWKVVSHPDTKVISDTMWEHEAFHATKDDKNWQAGIIKT